MKLEIVGPSYDMDAVSFDAQRTINMYPIMAEVKGTKEVTALRQCPGLTEYITAGGGPIRGMIETGGRCFVVSGFDFYEIEADGTATDHGTLDTGNGQVVMEYNTTQIMVTDGVSGYTFDYDTDTFAKITDVDFPTPKHLAFQDGYFIVVKDSTQQFYISNLNDGDTWDALDFTSVESNADNLVACVSDNANLWLFGEKTTEVYRNTGAAAFPFERIPGAIIETGCAAQHSVKQMDNSIFWLGTDEQGHGIVWKAAGGYEAQRVSTQAIEKKLDEAEDYTESYAWVYHQRGHVFYCLQVKGLDSTLVYDAATGQWHERQFKNKSENEEQLHLGSSHVFFDNKNLVGSRLDNKIYELSLDVYDDAGDEMHRIRISPHYQDGKRLITHAQLELDCEVGQGLQSGNGSDPQIMLEYSDDGGWTYGNQMFRDLGKVGEYYNRVKFNKLGRARDRVYKITVTDPVFFQLNGAELNGT